MPRLDVQVKVCGITRITDAALAVELGASAVGFIFWPTSPRFIDPFRARAIAKTLPAFVTPVGVFVDQPLEYVEGVASLVRLGAVQLHGSETAEYCRQVTRPVIKAIPEPFDLSRLDGMSLQITLLLDVHDPARRGGTGRTVDWSAASRIAATRRAILSGGLNPANIAKAIATVQPYGIDVSSGVESSPGIKDESKLKAFFDALRGASTQKAIS
jgi:phosphoribosylanthranilate isomerase